MHCGNSTPWDAVADERGGAVPCAVRARACERFEKHSTEKRELHGPRKASESSALMGLKTSLFSSRTRVKTTLGERVWTVVTGVLDVAARKALQAIHLGDSPPMMFSGPHTLTSSRLTKPVHRLNSNRDLS